MIPSASAASVPGRIGIHSSHCCAVRVRMGSMQMIVAPFSRARSTNGQRCGLDVRVFVPQSSTRSQSGIDSASAPMLAPTVMRMPAPPHDEQIVRSSFDAPSVWKKRRSIDSPCSLPIVPAYE